MWRVAPLLLVQSVVLAPVPGSNVECRSDDCVDDEPALLQVKHRLPRSDVEPQRLQQGLKSRAPSNRSSRSGRAALLPQTIDSEVLKLFLEPETLIPGRQRQLLTAFGSPHTKNCDNYECKLVEVAASDIGSFVAPGTPPFASLQGVFWIEDSWNLLRVVSFKDWETEYQTDGSVILSGAIYQQNRAAWSRSGFFSAVREVYDILNFGRVFAQLKCTLVNGELSECSVTPSTGGIFEMPVGTLVRVSLVRLAGAEVAFQGRTELFDNSWLSYTWSLRQILDGGGARAPAWDAFVGAVGEQRLLVPTLTSEKRDIPAVVRRFWNASMITAHDIINWIDEGLAQVLIDVVERDYDKKSPSFDVYEYKLNDVRPTDAMCPLKRLDSYVIGAFNVAGGGFVWERPVDNPVTAMQVLSKIINAFDGVQKVLRGHLWSYAASKSGGTVDPATNKFLHEEGPIPILSSTFGVLTWNDVSNLGLVFVALPAFLLGSGGSRLAAFMNFAKVTCFEPTVLGNGPQKFKWDAVDALIMSPGQRRGFYTATVPSGLFIFNYDAAIMLSTGEAQHTQLRQAYTSMGLAASFDVPLNAIAAAATDVSSVTESAVGALVLPTVLTMLWGVEPPSDVLSAIAPYLTFGKMAIFGQPVCDYLLCPTGLSGKITTARVAARKWALTTPYAETILADPAVKRYIEGFPGADQAPADLEYTADDSEEGWLSDWWWGRRRRSPAPRVWTKEEQNFVQNVMDISLFAGFVGTSDLTLKCVTYQQQNSSLQALFEEDPEAFIIEVMRADSAVTSVTSLLAEDEAMILEGVNVTMAKGSPVQNVIATANRDLTHWDSPDEINPKRANLGDSLSWNGRARYVESKDFQKAPRFCPGYCTSIKAGAAICAKYMGSFDRLQAENKIGGPAHCENFNRDCRGEWSEWSACSASCSGGERRRTYTVTHPAKGSGRACGWSEGEVQTHSCNEQLCPAKCFEEVEGTCMQLNWKALKDTCPVHILEIARVIGAAGAAFHFHKHLSFIPEMALQYVDHNRLLINGSAATWDVEAFDEFTYTEWFLVVMLGLRGVAVQASASAEAIPTKLAQWVPSYWVGPTIIPSYDVDENVGLDQLQQLFIQCFGLELRDGIVWRDDLDVAMRNRWELVMSKDKYYTDMIERMLGHPFKRMADYVYEKFVWYSGAGGRPLYPMQWDFARLFLRNYDEIYSTPMVKGSWRFQPGVWEDSAEKFLAFDNLAAHRVFALDAPIQHGGETAVYAVTTSKWRVAGVREGFGKLGADMYFNADGMPLAVSDGTTTYWKRGDGAVSEREWQYWKFVWRSSMGVIVTAREHLLYTHMFMSNVLATASREALGPIHPLRRFLTRWTWGTIAIDNSAQGTLVGSKVITGRSMPFSDFTATMQALWASMDNVYDTMKPLRDPGALQHALLRKSPYYTNGSAVFNLVRDMAGDFLELYQWDWCKLGALDDAEVLAFQRRLRSVAATMNAEKLLDVPPSIPNARAFDACAGLAQLHELLSALLFGVSGWHSQVGTVAGFYLDPEFASFSWRDGEAFAPPKQHLITTGLAASTAKVMPTMIDDYSHHCKGILKETECVSLYHTYRYKFILLSSELSKAEQGNPLKYFQMNPNFVENSVAK